MANVVHLFRAPRRGKLMEELSEAHVIENAGFENCVRARPGGKRQVLLLDIETLTALNLRPGLIRENITTEGVELNALAVGQRLHIGDVELQVSAVCVPCELMDEVRAGLMEELQGRRGMLCRVTRGGTISRGDELELQQ